MARTLRTEGRKLIDLRTKSEKADKVAKDAKAKLATQQRVVFDLLGAEGIKTTTIDLGGDYGEVSFGARRKIFARVFDLDKLIDALREEGREDEAIKHDVRKAPLNELVRERQETGEKLPEGLDFSDTPYVQITRKKKG